MFPAKCDLGLLHPIMRKRVTAWLVLCANYGLKIKVTETRRSKARQLWLWAKGRFVSPTLEKEYLGYDNPEISSRPGEKKVTWTLQSNHLKGYAVDFGFMVNGYFTYNGNWELAYILAEKCGLKSLFRTSGIDRPHLDFDFVFKE